MGISTKAAMAFGLVGIAAVLLGGCVHHIGTAQDSVQWKFAFVSDTQGDNREQVGKSCIGDAIVRTIAEDIARENPDFVLVGGDLVNGWFRNGHTDYATQFANWKAAMEPVYRAGIRVFPVRGNHEDGPERLALPPLPTYHEPPSDAPMLLKRAFCNAFSEPYSPRNGPEGEEGITYSFSHRNALIIGLDEYGAHQHRVDQNWLDRELAQKNAPHVFVYGHEPAFETRNRDNLAFFANDRDTFWDSIGKAGGRVYFCGHDHFYNRAVIPDSMGNPIRQIIASTGGGRLVPWSGEYPEGTRVKGEYSDSDHYGYLLVTVEGLKVTVAWKGFSKEDVPVAWRVLDSFSYMSPEAQN
ncbi:MAG: Calcineurin-like phosphoesterase [Syntrophorhabdaceae bacterium PtaU1.Bin034]|nr:MAG: Calcineurin-like phosphoesterase [Syntrophorhabdaceae bacterium PtaU1.Bin034]